MGRHELIKNIRSYHSEFLSENAFKEKFLELLKHPNSFFRNHLPGHLTASAFVVDPEVDKVLLVHHAKLNRWLQPGGHADGDEDLLAVALREVNEETGVARPSNPLNSFFDIDIHIIPANRDFPEHNHFDIRYLLLANSELPVSVSNESNDVKWISLGDLTGYTEEKSILRMKQKYLDYRKTI